MDLTEQQKYFQSRLKKLGTKKRAEAEKKYLKSDLNHYGVSVPDVRNLAKEWIKKEDPSLSKLTKFSKHLWSSDWYEEKSLALFLLSYKADDLRYKHLQLFETFASQTSTWAHLDVIAVDLVGSVLEKDRSGLILLPLWIKSGNFWVRRMALLSQLKLFRVGKGNMTLFKNLVTTQLDEPEYWGKEERFFIRKAIGWVLRERSKADPESVVKFVNEYADRLSGLSYREATRNLPEKYKKQLTKKPD